MRIVAGKARGVHLLTPPGVRTRPTSERVKEALFSSLERLLPNAEVLDLFAGTGQIGLEALSRGAAHCVFVERHVPTARLVRANVARARFEDQVEVLACPAERAVKRLAEVKRRFDFVYLDPPWRHGDSIWAALAPWWIEILNPGATVVLESPSQAETPAFVTQLEQTKRCRYGGTMLFFFQQR